MNAKTAAAPSAAPAQEVCIDLPGESVQCWRSSDNIKVVLRKHRDVFFDINLKPGTSYTVESSSVFYSARDKKILKKCQFQDGVPFHLWVGREYTGSLILKSEGKTLGTFEVKTLDSKKYDSDPKTKPEPLMVILGKRNLTYPLSCTPDDKFGISNSQKLFKPLLDPKMSFMKTYGTEFDYRSTSEEPEVKEYANISDALPHEIQPQVLKQLDSGLSVEGAVTEIFIQPTINTPKSGLYLAMASAFSYISGNDILTSNIFKETAGYLQEHWKSLNRGFMLVRIEKRVIGKYRVVFKGRPFVRAAAQLLGIGASSAVSHKKMPFGSAGSSFLDGGFAKTGKNGFGGFKRVMLTSAQNFKGGVKIQIVGTVIDLIGDVNTVYFDEKGSKDLSEFLGRAGVSIVKAGATAALGSAFAAIFAVGAVAAFGVAGAPVFLVAGVVIAGYIAAATIVDWIDGSLGIKDTVAGWSK